MSYETQSLSLNLFYSFCQLFFETPYKTLKFQEKVLRLQANDAQAMLLQSEGVLEMHFPANWRPKFQKALLWYPPWGNLKEIVDQTNSKETESLRKNGCRQKCFDESLVYIIYMHYVSRYIIYYYFRIK